MNFLLAKVCNQITDEEKAFWLFATLIEDFFPIDYFSSMVGVIVDQRIFSELLNFVCKETAMKFNQLECDSSLFNL